MKKHLHPKSSIFCLLFISFALWTACSDQGTNGAVIAASLTVPPTIIFIAMGGGVILSFFFIGLPLYRNVTRLTQGNREPEDYDNDYSNPFGYSFAAVVTSIAVTAFVWIISFTTGKWHSSENTSTFLTICFLYFSSLTAMVITYRLCLLVKIIYLVIASSIKKKKDYRDTLERYDFIEKDIQQLKLTKPTYNSKKSLGYGETSL